MKEFIVGGLFALAMTATLLPSLLHDAKRYCDLGYKLCVDRPVPSKDMVQS